MMKHPALRRSSFVTCHSPRDWGFTLLELLVICLILAFLVLTLGPALARSSSGSRVLQCINNHRQLCTVWRLYADDNRDLIVYASDDGTGTSPYLPNSGLNPQNDYAWTWSKMSFAGQSGFEWNWDPAADMTLRPLWPYTGKETNLFKCPSDRSYVVTGGQMKPRIRSVSMNFFLGGFAGSSENTSGTIGYQLYTKISQITVPNKIFVFLDQRADNISWGNFLTDMTGYAAYPSVYKISGDFPGIYHDHSCTFSFIDGHVEEHRWLDPRTTPAPGNLPPTAVSSPNNPDVAWLQDHASRPR